MQRVAMSSDVRVWVKYISLAGRHPIIVGIRTFRDSLLTMTAVRITINMHSLPILQLDWKRTRQ